MSLPLEVTCHRTEDGPRFAENHSFDRDVQGFGWSDPSHSYTWGRRFQAPSGLDALLLDHSEKSVAEEEPDQRKRGTSLLVFAMGRLIDRVEGAQWLAQDPETCFMPERNGSSPFDEPSIPIPSETSDFNLSWSRIDREGKILLQRITYRNGQQVREESNCDILCYVPRYTLLKRVSVMEGGLHYTFTDAEIAQLEAAIAEYRGIGDLLLPVIVEAARYKFNELTSPVWRVIAGMLGISEESVRQSFQQYETWWEGYARMHDGENPEA